MGQTQGCMLTFCPLKARCWKFLLYVSFWDYYIILQAEKTAFDEAEKKNEAEVLFFGCTWLIFMIFEGQFPKKKTKPTFLDILGFFLDSFKKKKGYKS